MCNCYGHSVLKCQHCFDHSFQAENAPSALMAAPSSVYDYNWYPDSGATHHLTANLCDLNSPSEYNGSDSDKIGNGKGMVISHIGHSSLRSPMHAFAFNNILHVPSASQNLPFVSKCTSDNNVYFELHPHSFFVNDWLSGNILPSGQNKGGLYCLRVDSQAPIQSTILTGERISLDMCIVVSVIQVHILFNA